MTHDTGPKRDHDQWRVRVDGDRVEVSLLAPISRTHPRETRLTLTAAEARALGRIFARAADELGEPS